MSISGIPDAVKNALDFASFVRAVKEAAKDAGTDCDCLGCDALTLGQRCANCARRVCVGHAFWNLSGARASVLCPFCVVAACANLFADDDGERR